MLSAIGSDAGASASAIVNAYLRELGGARGRRGPSGSERVERGEAPQTVGGKSELTEEEKQQVEKLKRRDQEVRRHEAAHKAAAGRFAVGGPKFEYKRGPDGRQYAAGGEVSIDTSAVEGDPSATIRKMQQVRRAATAPADPSSQDRQVAAEAGRIEAQARAELAQRRRGGGGGDGQGGGAGFATASSAGGTPRGGSSIRDTIANRFSPARAPGQFIDVSA